METRKQIDEIRFVNKAAALAVAGFIVEVGLAVAVGAVAGLFLGA